MDPTSDAGWELIIAELDARIDLQQRRVLTLAQRLDPRLSADDCLQPHDCPALRDHPGWNYQDGVLAGLHEARSACMLLRARGSDGG